METSKRKNYTEEFLNSKNCKQLFEFCRKNKIPYIGLNKKQTIENITEWSTKDISKLEEFPHKGVMDPDFIKNKPKGHKLGIKARRLCFEYSTKGKTLSREEWAKRLGVGITSINKWLSWPESKALIATFQKSYEDRVLQKFADQEENVVDELMRVINSRKITDVKRKAINDFFGYIGRVNVNEKGTNINVNQKQGQKQISMTQNIQQMSQEEIDAEIKELENMGD